jgi:hypothetical protein
MRANEDESVPLCNSKRALLLAEHVELHVGSDAPLCFTLVVGSRYVMARCHQQTCQATFDSQNRNRSAGLNTPALP